MRRGFLNSTPAKKRPNNPSTAFTAHVGEQASSAALEKPVIVPKGYEIKINYVQGPEDPSNPATHIWTTLPRVHDEPNTECLFLRGSEQIITGTPGFPRGLPPASSPPAFRRGHSPGKGLGLFSTRPIKQGDIILWERPLLIAPAGVPTKKLPPDCSEAQRAQHNLNEYERYIAIAVNRMTEDRRVAFMGLHNCHQKDGSGPFTGIIRTNGVGLSGLQPWVEDAKMSNYSATLEHISRLNHSCSSNTQPRFDRATFAYKLYAVRDIAEGEELTFHYLDVLVNKTKRAEILRPYAVVCTCTACTENPTASDKRRSAIASFMPSVPVWAVNRELSDDWLIKKSLQILEFIEKEKVEHVAMYSMVTCAVLDAYICLGDRQNASKWAAKVMIRHRWAEEYKRVEELLDPNSPAYMQHPLWRLRVDENPTNDMGAMYKLMAEACGPGGITTMDNGVGLFTYTRGQEIPPETMRKMMAMVKKNEQQEIREGET
ncbi:Aldehyde dehydrogenase [Mycena indigotica]|uniref:Aldehyde dehydrogenase n=1 Tax=Mycena indigotica TaxID=2126181 RepID=A0A8H6RZS1_9AGAR|nr:Aldehyde dehydrogenase [Mycena indigotica]KAF7289257.1 Aldehyde dehydrogenase [Mycena indigotica]